MVQLDEFIENALVQIANGVFQANRRLTKTDEPKGTVPFLLHRGNDGGQTTGIAFDVAVTTRLSAEVDVDGKASIFVVDAALDTNASYHREQVSRLRFIVGVDTKLGYGLNTLVQSKSDP